MTMNVRRLTDSLADLSILRKNWSGYENNFGTHEVIVNGDSFGGAHPVIIAGPCAVESFEQTSKIAKSIADMGIRVMRGGAFKPRTRPQDFQGLGLEGLRILDEVRREYSLAVATEVMEPGMVEKTAECADILQVGSRSMYNYPLLQEVGKAHKPVLLKRAWCATLEEWLWAAEYVARAGAKDIILCERGIRTSVQWSYSRNTLDLNVIDPIRRLTPLPIIADPSHASGDWKVVPPLSRAAIAAGAHGLLIEAIEKESSRSGLHCDSEQGLSLDVLASLHEEITAIRVASLIE